MHTSAYANFEVGSKPHRKCSYTVQLLCLTGISPLRRGLSMFSVSQGCFFFVFSQRQLKFYIGYADNIGKNSWHSTALLRIMGLNVYEITKI